MKHRHPLLHHLRWVLNTWVPVIVLLVAIFIASAQPKRGALPDQSGNFYMSGMMPVFTGNWDVVVKKSAHVLSYGLLSLLLFRALGRSGLKVREASLYALLLAMSYALTDELHQAFVPGRHSSVLDIGFDYMGAASASLLAGFWGTRQTFPTPSSPGAFPAKNRALLTGGHAPRSKHIY